MHAIEQNIQGEVGEWLPISGKDAQDFSRVISEEALFLDGGSDHALRLFRQIMQTAVQSEGSGPDTERVWRAYKLMKFISDRLTEYFRIRVGIEVSRPEPLVDIDLLGACWIINRFHFADYDLPTKGLFKLPDSGTALELIALARENPEHLKSELLRLKQAVSENSSFFFEALTHVQRYLNELEALKK